MKSIFPKKFFYFGFLVLLMQNSVLASYGGAPTVTNLTIPGQTTELDIVLPSCSSLSGNSYNPYTPNTGYITEFGQLSFSAECPGDATVQITLTTTDGTANNYKPYKLTTGGLTGVSATYTYVDANNQIVTYIVADNGPLDTNPAVGIIDDPVVFLAQTQSVVSGGGGGGVVMGIPGANINWATYLAPVVELTGQLGGTVGSVLGATTTVSSSVPENFRFNRNLYLGSRHSDVVLLQKFLINSGYMKNITNFGYFGPMTWNAVKAYQKKNGIVQTGFFGPKTRASVNSILSNR